MELSPVQRFAAFAAVVLVLAGLGAYLFLPQSSAAGTGQPPSSPRSSSPRSGEGTGSPAPAGQSQPDIYQWLPFTKAGLANAAATTIAFATHYGTYSYRQNAQEYLAPMHSLITSQLAVALGRAYAAPGLAGARIGSRQTATASAEIVSLRAFGPSSLTFVVVVKQRITSAKGPSLRTTDYAVTLTGTGPAWQVNDIELASAGNL
jgi:hypothetical protein